MEDVTVSVVMVTYGHEKFIKEAIESVLDQICDKNIELIVSNDCSPDNTDLIINDIINNHENAFKLKYFKHESNIGMMPNFIFSLNKAKGKYIALCDGDDYWIDNHKLQKQIDVIEKNDEIAIVFHQVLINNNGLLNNDDLNIEKKIEFNFKDIQDKNWMHTSSILFKSSFLKIPNWFINAMPGDHVIQLLVMINDKKAIFIDEVMSVYRLHDNGSWSTDSGKKYRVKRALTNILLHDHFNIKETSKLRNAIFMIADDINENGFKNISRIKYYSLIIQKFYILFQKVNLLYIIFPQHYKIKK